MKKTELTRVSALITELKTAGITVSETREGALTGAPSLSSFFKSAFGLELNEALAGAELKISIAENNTAIKTANKAGKQTTRTRLIRYLTDPGYIARDGVKFDAPAEA